MYFDVFLTCSGHLSEPQHLQEYCVSVNSRTSNFKDMQHLSVLIALLVILVGYHLFIVFWFSMETLTHIYKQSNKTALHNDYS